MFGRKNHEAPVEASVEAPKPVEARSKRERPDFDAIAKQNRDSFTAEGSKYDKFVKGLAKVRDFGFSFRARRDYAIGLAVDKGTAGAEAVGRGAKATVEGVKYAGTASAEAVGRTVATGVEGVRAGVEFGVDKAVAAADVVIEGGKEGGKYVYNKGKNGVEAVWGGMKKGAEAAHTRFTEVRTGITEKYRSMREALQNRADMRAFAADQKKLDEYRAKMASLESKAGLKQANMAEIQQRLAARGITREESEPSEAMAA